MFRKLARDIACSSNINAVSVMNAVMIADCLVSLRPATAGRQMNFGLAQLVGYLLFVQSGSPCHSYMALGLGCFAWFLCGF